MFICGEAVIFAKHPVVKSWTDKVLERGVLEKAKTEGKRNWNRWRDEVEVEDFRFEGNGGRVVVQEPEVLHGSEERGYL